MLSMRVRDIISDRRNHLFLSASSAWEIAIKAHLGKLRLPSSPDEFIVEQLALNGIEPLSISLLHALHAGALPHHHRDPFDRLLIAQSQLEDLPLLTSDEAIMRYQVDTIW